MILVGVLLMSLTILLIAIPWVAIICAPVFMTLTLAFGVPILFCLMLCKIDKKIDLIPPLSEDDELEDANLVPESRKVERKEKFVLIA